MSNFPRRLPMSNGEIPDIGEIVAFFPLRGGWGLWVGKMEDGLYAIDIHHPHPKDPNRRGWFSIVMTGNLPLKMAKLLNEQPWVAEEAREDGTIGVICPVVLIRTAEDGSVQRYVAIEKKKRHIGVIPEVSRRSWTNQREIVLPENVKVEFHNVGFTHKNTARMSGVKGEPIKLQVAIVRIKAGEKWPKLPKGVSWVKFETYTHYPDGAGKDALFNALVSGFLN